MCRVGQRVNGQKQYLAISFFSPSAENQNWKKGQTPTILAKPSASERMIPFLMNEIFQFQSVDDAGNAAPYIEAYYNKSKVFLVMLPIFQYDFSDGKPPGSRRTKTMKRTACTFMVL